MHRRVNANLWFCTSDLVTILQWHWTGEWRDASAFVWWEFHDKLILLEWNGDQSDLDFLSISFDFILSLKVVLSCTATESVCANESVMSSETGAVFVVLLNWAQRYLQVNREETWNVSFRTLITHSYECWWWHWYSTTTTINDKESRGVHPLT